MENLSYKFFKLLIIGFLAVVAPFYFFSINAFIFKKSGSLQSLDSNFSKTIIVLGAGIRGKKPSLILQKRLDTAVQMYKARLIDNILVSGDNQNVSHNEPQVMFNYLLSMNVAKKNIFADYGGRRTMDTCLRAKQAFKVKTAYITTQDFHLPRTVFLCQSVGVEVRGVVAKDPSFISYKIYYITREIGASWRALGDTIFYELPIKPDGTEPNLG